MAKPRPLDPEEWELWHTWMHAQRLLARELDRCLQRDHGISKTEFSVLVTLSRAPRGQLRVAALIDSLGWEKSRVSHQLTRMENRGLIHRTDSTPGARRITIALTPQGRQAVRNAVATHGANIRHLFFDQLTPAQTAAIRTWSAHTIARIDPDGAAGP